MYSVYDYGAVVAACSRVFAVCVLFLSFPAVFSSLCVESFTCLCSACVAVLGTVCRMSRPHPPCRSAVGSRAFPVADPKTWNALLKDVTSSQSEYTFCRQAPDQNVAFQEVVSRRHQLILTARRLLA